MLQETSRVHEAVNTQMQSMERPEQVNKLSPNDRQAKEKKGNATGVVELVILHRTRAVQHWTRLVINVVKVVTLRLAARKSQPRNPVEDIVQKELIKSQKRKKEKTTMRTCWIRRVVMARVLLLIGGYEKSQRGNRKRKAPHSHY